MTTALDEVDRLAEYRRLARRALVLQYGDLPAVWDETDDYGADPTVVARDCGCGGEAWRFCLAPEACLAVALLVDDPAPWRAGLTRADRTQIWAELERLAVRLDPWIAPAAREAA